MEGRRLKRFDSAPLPGSPLPVSHPPRPNLSVAAAAATDAAAKALYHRKLEAYYQCMEEDNSALTSHYEKHVAEIAGLKALVQEARFTEVAYAAMEEKVAKSEEFLAEAMALLTTSRGLRQCTNMNHKSATGKKVAARGEGSPMSGAGPTPTIDDVRDALQKQQQVLQSLWSSETKYLSTISALEKELAGYKNHKAKSGASSMGLDDCCLPGTAKEVADLQLKVRDLERQLNASSKQARLDATELAELRQQRTTDLQTLNRRDDEVLALRSLIHSKEKVIASLEVKQPVAYTRTNSAPPATIQAHRSRNKAAVGTSTSAASAMSGGESCGDQLVVSHHYRLFAGQGYVDAVHDAPEQFKDTMLRSMSEVVHVPYGYLSSAEVRTHTEAVSVELDIRHSSKIAADEIDFLLLSSDHPELGKLLQKVREEREAKHTRPEDRRDGYIRELQASLEGKEKELQALRQRMQEMACSLERRDADRAAMDSDIDTTLTETEATVKGLYESLQSSQQEMEVLKKSALAKQAQLRAAEQDKTSALDALKSAMQAEVDSLTVQLEEVRTSLRHAQEAADQTISDMERAKLEAFTACFEMQVAVEPTPGAVAVVEQEVLTDSQTSRVVKELLLHQASLISGTTPVLVKSIKLSGSGSSPPTSFLVKVQLTFYASRLQKDSRESEIHRKLQKCTTATVAEYLRQRQHAAQSIEAAERRVDAANATAEEQAASLIADLRRKEQQAHMSEQELRREAAEQLKEIESSLCGVTTSTELRDTTTGGVVRCINALVSRLTSAEAEQHRASADVRHLTQQLADARHATKQLQEDVLEVTAQMTDLRADKDQAQAGLSAALAQLHQLQQRSSEREVVLQEKVKRLEGALVSKTASAEESKKELLRYKQAADNRSADGGAAAPFEERALREALRISKQEVVSLTRQVKELETDMNDLSNIQASLHGDLEISKQELRAKKHDFDMLVKQLVQMEETEKKLREQLRSAAVQQSEAPNSNGDDDRLEKDAIVKSRVDDAVRETLVSMTNSNTTLQQCIRRLTTASSYLASERFSTSTPFHRIGSGRAAERPSLLLPDGRGTLSTTVSRVAADQQQLVSQLAQTLLPFLDGLEASQKKSSSRATAVAGYGEPSLPPTPKSGSAAVNTAGATTSSSSPNVSVGTTAASSKASIAFFSRQLSATSAPRIVKYPHQDSFTRTKTTPSSSCIAAIESPDKDGAAATAVLKATVDDAPRLDFHRQNSSRAYLRNQTAAAGGVGLQESTSPPPPVVAVVKSSGAAGQSDSMKSAAAKEQRQMKTSSVATKANPFQRSGTNTGSSTSRLASAYRRVPAPEQPAALVRSLHSRR